MEGTEDTTHEDRQGTIQARGDRYLQLLHCHTRRHMFTPYIP